MLLKRRRGRAVSGSVSRPIEPASGAMGANRPCSRKASELRKSCAAESGDAASLWAARKVRSGTADGVQHRPLLVNVDAAAWRRWSGLPRLQPHRNRSSRCTDFGGGLY
jgi:hypothetical protein